MNESQINCRESDRINPPCVMVLGDVHRAEMKPLVAWLEDQLSSCAGSHCDPEIPHEENDQRRSAQSASAIRIVATDVEAALDSHIDLFPDLIVVLQSWPSEYARRDVDRLFSFAPLARIVVCYGAWCESDGRNQNIWPIAVRVPAWAAQARIAREWELIRNPSESPALPWSASREEVFAADHPSISTWSETRSFLVDSPDHAYRQSLIEIMIAAGHELVCENPQVLLFDADPWGPVRADALRMQKAKHPSTTIVALLNLAQPSLNSELHGFGFTSVRSKLGFC